MAGEAVTVHVRFSNPLGVKLKVTGVRLLAEFTPTGVSGRVHEVTQGRAHDVFLWQAWLRALSHERVLLVEGQVNKHLCR